MSLEGARELSRQLTNLGREAGGKALRTATGKAMRPALNRARNTIPVGLHAHKTYKGRLVAPGFSKRSVKVVTYFISHNRARAFAALGVRKEAFYALHFVELGVPSRGIAARPWLVPAFESTTPQQIEVLMAQLRAGIERAIRKQGAA